LVNTECGRALPCSYLAGCMLKNLIDGKPLPRQ
jgi:hypothetical protein